ncbi:deoxynucleoside kinase, partial [Bacteroidia bacterium]|nr:deoxynucleoside kinase [Bacteroidia bacterium]
TYQALFTNIKTSVDAPDLLIYLRSSIGNIVSQIQKRGREYEDSIRLDYLKRLNERYEAWISTYKEGNLLIIDVDDIDFENNPEDLGAIISKIDGEVNGLF